MHHNVVGSSDSLPFMQEMIADAKTVFAKTVFVAAKTVFATAKTVVAAAAIDLAAANIKSTIGPNIA